jgi:hypothetical protein
MDDELETEKDQKEQRISRFWYIGGFVFVGGILVLSLGGFYLSQKLPKEIPETPIPTSIPVMPTPTPSFTPSKWHVEVLNGSQIKGSANKIADQLRQDGFIVDSIGNAQTARVVQESQVEIAPGFLSDKEEFFKRISSILPHATYSGELSSSFSASIIIGRLDVE